MTLGPALAAILAQQAAVASFPLGGALGSLSSRSTPGDPGGAASAVVAGLTGGLVVSVAVRAAFAGIVPTRCAQARSPSSDAAPAARCVGAAVARSGGTRFRGPRLLRRRLLDLFQAWWRRRAGWRCGEGSKGTRTRLLPRRLNPLPEYPGSAAFHTAHYAVRCVLPKLHF